MNDISNLTLPVTVFFPKVLSSNQETAQPQAPVEMNTVRPVLSTNSNVSTTAPKDQQQYVDPLTIDQAVEIANKRLKDTDTNLKFEIDKITNEVVISIVDETGESQLQIPSVAVLKFLQAMALQESNKGNLYAGVA